MPDASSTEDSADAGGDWPLGFKPQSPQEPAPLFRHGIAKVAFPTKKLAFVRSAKRSRESENDLAGSLQAAGLEKKRLTFYDPRTQVRLAPRRSNSQLNYQQYQQRQRWIDPRRLAVGKPNCVSPGRDLRPETPTNVVMKLLYLQSENRRKDIHFYLNSPGGDRGHRHTRHLRRTMQTLSCPVATYCVGQAASGAADAPGGRHQRASVTPLPHATRDDASALRAALADR